MGTHHNCGQYPRISFENGVFDIGITVFNPDGTGIIYSTIAGGEGMEFPASVVSDSNGDFYVFGPTGSGDFPIIEEPMTTLSTAVHT